MKLILRNKKDNSLFMDYLNYSGQEETSNIASLFDESVFRFIFRDVHMQNALS